MLGNAVNFGDAVTVVDVPTEDFEHQDEPLDGLSSYATPTNADAMSGRVRSMSAPTSEPGTPPSASTAGVDAFELADAIKAAQPGVTPPRAGSADAATTREVSPLHSDSSRPSSAGRRARRLLSARLAKVGHEEAREMEPY